MGERSASRAGRTALAVTLLLAPPAGAQEAAPAAEVVAAERAFAERARDAGAKAAFLEYLAPDAVLFRPGPVNGPEATRSQPESPLLLAWHPVVADISEARDLGYSTGPFQVRPAAAAAPVSTGYYLTLWRRQPDGSLRAVLDHGLVTAAPADTSEALALWAGDVPAGEPVRADPEALDAALLEGTGAVHERVRIMAAGAVHAGAAARASLFASERPATTMLGSGSSRDGDLAYAYGEYRWRGESGYYVRIWRRGAGGMDLVVELLSPAQLP